MKKETNYKKYIELLVMMILIIGIMTYSMSLDFVDTLKPESSTEKVFMIVGIVFMGFLVLGVHELGHLLMGLWNGFAFQLYVVGPLGIKREDEKIKVYFNKNLGYYGGVAATSPVDDHKDNAKKFAQVLLAGPISSFLFAILCFGLAYFLGKPLGILFYIGGLISIAICIATTVPSSSGMFFSDRKRYQRLVNPGKDQDVELALINIMGKFAKDSSYKNVPKNDIDILVADDIPFIKFIGLFNLICYQLEVNGEISEEASLEYENHSKKMSKQLVLGFNKELDKFKEHLMEEENKKLA
ncbi:MAG: site-2 protease family protein [Saprospiraceae bacterium]|nr:site-2 protease family protein [Saprospiraceae bacterium]